MRDIDEHNITRAVIARLADGDNLRLREIVAALVRHAHDFAREIRLTEAEWEQGIAFLTATGQMCSGTRQEFILLSDTLGISMLVTALNNALPPGATEATVFGPFHTDDAPAAASGSDIAGGAPGDPLYAQIEIVDLQGRPVADAEVDIWQADAQGLYDVQQPALGAQRRARARMRADAQGRLRFRSVMATPYPVPTDGPVGRMLRATGRHPWRPAHVHFLIRAPGFHPLTTHLFRAGDPYLDSDAVFGVRSSLIGDFVRHDGGTTPDGSRHDGPFYVLQHRFVLAPARAATASAA
jgi:hydroxyquinol 1,2-dioxygenase